MTVALHAVGMTVNTEAWLSAIDLDLEAGELYILLGPTLAGKTSLLRLLAGLERPSAGQLLVDGVDGKTIPVRRRSVAMVYQQFINYPSFTVYDNIASPLRRAGLEKAEVDRQVRETAGLLHISDFLGRLPAELSGGQQQRTALARALVKQADLLLLDEPLVNLDYKLREALRDELRAIFARRASTVVYATTEPLEALMMGGQAVVMDEGRVLQIGPTTEVYRTPASERVGAIFSDPPMNMIDGVVEGENARLGDGLALPLRGHLASLGAGRYRFGVRCGHLFVDRRSADDLEIAGTLELAEINGSETFIHTRHAGVSWVAQEAGVRSFALGQPIRLYLDPRHIFAFDQSGRLAAAPAVN